MSPLGIGTNWKSSVGSCRRCQGGAKSSYLLRQPRRSSFCTVETVHRLGFSTVEAVHLSGCSNCWEMAWRQLLRGCAFLKNGRRSPCELKVRKLEVVSLKGKTVAI